MIRERLSIFKSPHWVLFFLWAALCLTGPFACTGGMGLADGVSPIGSPEGGEAIGEAINVSAPPPLQGPTQNGAAAPDVMGPKGDDSHMGDNDWTAPHVISDGQRLRYGPTAQNAPVVDPDAEPLTVHIPSDGSLNLLVELLLEEDGGAWRSDEVSGPYIRLVYLPYQANGQLSMNGLFRDIRLTEKNAEGFNAVFDHLNLNPGEISIWYYEAAATPVKKPNWEDAIFLSPPLNVPFQEEMAPINFADFWNFAAEPYTRHLGRFRQENLSYNTQPPQNFAAHPAL